MKKTLFFFGFLLFASQSWAADVGFNISIGAPGFYLSVGNFFGYPEREVIVIRERGIPDNDLPVVFFLSHHAHVPPEVIINLRVGQGWSWSRICAYYRVPPAIFYIPVQSYGPPFGHAYGHYRHHPHARDWDRIRMTDDIIINQVNLIFISRYYNCPPERVIRLREQGSSFGKETKMKTALAIVMTSVLAASFGCQSTSPRGGGVSSDEGFKIVVPSTDTEIKQGEVQTVAVALQRGEFFKRDVKLEIKATKGISVDPTNAVIKASAKPDVQLRITAAKNAALGEYRVYVRGSPETGEPTSVEFTVKVVAP